MKQQYICPALNIEEAQAVNMLAESLGINSDITVDGGNALTKEVTWDFWDDDDTPEE